MPGFQFELSQLVNVPGKDQQGRVSGRMEFINDETLYQIKWLDAAVSIDVGMFAEGELFAAQVAASLPAVNIAGETPQKPARRRSKSRSKRK